MNSRSKTYTHYHAGIIRKNSLCICSTSGGPSVCRPASSLIKSGASLQTCRVWKLCRLPNLAASQPRGAPPGGAATAANLLTHDSLSVFVGRSAAQAAAACRRRSTLAHARSCFARWRASQASDLYDAMNRHPSIRCACHPLWWVWGPTGGARARSNWSPAARSRAVRAPHAVAAQQLCRPGAVKPVPPRAPAHGAGGT